MLVIAWSEHDVAEVRCRTPERWAAVDVEALTFASFFAERDKRAGSIIGARHERREHTRSAVAQIRGLFARFPRERRLKAPLRLQHTTDKSEENAE